MDIPGRVGGMQAAHQSPEKALADSPRPIHSLDCLLSHSVLLLEGASALGMAGRGTLESPFG